MKLEGIEVLVTKCEMKQNKEGKAYLLVDVLCMEDGSMFNVMIKDITESTKYKPMTKYLMDFALTSSKFGLRLEIVSVSKEMGNIT